MIKLTITDCAKHSKNHGSGDTIVTLQSSDEARDIVPAPIGEELVKAYRDQKPNMFGVKHTNVDDEWGQYSYRLSSKHPEFRNDHKISKLNSAKQ